MTLQMDADIDSAILSTAPPRRVSRRTVILRRIAGVLLVAVPVVWAWLRAVPEDSDIVNAGGPPLVAQLLASVLHPALASDFLAVVGKATVVTLIYATLGTAGALVIGLLGGLILSDAAWAQRPPMAFRILRLALRGLLVVARSVHELVWALLFVSVLGLDPLVAAAAIAIPFGAQTARVFGDIFDGVPAGPLLALRRAGAPPTAAMAYGLVPESAPLLLSYAFYRFECAIRSAVVLGIVGVGGLGQELILSLQSRNWDEVWTLIGAVLLLSAVVDLWSSQLRTDLAVVTCSDWSGGKETRRTGGTSRWARWTGAIVIPGVVLAWLVSDVSLSGLTSLRTRQLAGKLVGQMWPPALPPSGLPALATAMADTIAMATLAMTIAVALTIAISPFATRPRWAANGRGISRVRSLPRYAAWWIARILLLSLRCVPPTVWAVIALLVFFPGVLPGALALGLYTGGILGRLIAEAWESIDTRPRDILRNAGVPGRLASLAAVVPASGHHLVTYTLYRFEICVRDTAIVGVVGAAGLGRLLAENLAAFRFPAVTTLLVASITVSLVSEMVGRRLTRALRG
jgi:phosphonate transport system permease protein